MIIMLVLSDIYAKKQISFLSGTVAKLLAQMESDDGHSCTVLGLMTDFQSGALILSVCSVCSVTVCSVTMCSVTVCQQI